MRFYYLNYLVKVKFKEKFMEIRIATMADLKKILLIYEKAREFMRNTNNPNQWGINRP